jgi:hypothetical protein
MKDTLDSPTAAPPERGNPNFDSYRLASTEQPTDTHTGEATGSAGLVRRDPTQAQLDYAQKALDTGFNINDDGASKANDWNDKARFSSELSSLRLDPAQQKSFDTITQAMNATPPNLDVLNQIGKQFSNDPSKFKDVFTAVYDEHMLFNPNKINFMVDGTKPGKDITFSIPQPPQTPGWTNFQVNIPSDMYNKIYGY